MKIIRPTQNTAYIIFANFILMVKCNGELVTCDELMNTDLVTRDEFTVWRVHWFPALPQQMGCLTTQYVTPAPLRRIKKEKRRPKMESAHDDKAI